MNHDIAKLQILNDLIVQTIDVITQRNIMAQRAALLGGFSHTPYVADPRLMALNALGSVNPTVGINPMVGVNAYNGFAGGLGHTPYIDPRIALMGWGGLSHTAYDPRMVAGLGVVPQTVPFVQTGLGAWPQSQWTIAGLQHTPYVDPRIGYDPRLALASLGVSQSVPSVYGLPFGF